MIAWLLGDLCIIAVKVPEDKNLWILAEAISPFHYICNLSKESRGAEEQKSRRRAVCMIRPGEPLTTTPAV